MTAAAAPPATPPKIDPETLVLSAAPGRVVRFRRSMIITIAAAGATTLVGVAWLALKPPNIAIVAPSEERQTASRPAADALAGAPTGYGDIPQLGAPLPGDLGRPILSRQRENKAALQAAPPSGTADPAAQALEAERQRDLAERRAARESSVLVQLSRAAQPLPPEVSDASLASADPQPTSAGAPAVAGDADPNGQRRKMELVGRANATEDVNPHALIPAASPYTLTAGSIIAASLITGFNSDLPGLVTAQVTENAYDSVTGRTLLLPQGSRLIGSYDSVISLGQSRALVVWQRIILPDGSSVRIDNVAAADTQGYAGLTDRIDRRVWQVLKGVALSTLLGVGTELSFGSSESELVRAVRQSAQQSGARAGDQIVSRTLEIQPTLRVRPGWPLRVLVHKDIVLRPWQTLRR